MLSSTEAAPVVPVVTMMRPMAEMMLLHVMLAMVPVEKECRSDRPAESMRDLVVVRPMAMVSSVMRVDMMGTMEVALAMQVQMDTAMGVAK